MALIKSKARTINIKFQRIYISVPKENGKSIVRKSWTKAKARPQSIRISTKFHSSLCRVWHHNFKGFRRFYLLVLISSNIWKIHSLPLSLPPSLSVPLSLFQLGHPYFSLFRHRSCWLLVLWTLKLILRPSLLSKVSRHHSLWPQNSSSYYTLGSVVLSPSLQLSYTFGFPSWLAFLPKDDILWPFSPFLVEGVKLHSVSLCRFWYSLLVVLWRSK